MKRIVVVSIGVLVIVGASVGGHTHAAETDPIGWISIPALRFWHPIYAVPLENENWDLTTLGNGVAHLDGTNWINDGWGRVVLAGHTPGAFEHINTLKPGDLIIVSDRDHLAKYRVEGSHVVTDLTQDSDLNPTLDHTTLALLTCAGNNRLVVTAVLIEVK